MYDAASSILQQKLSQIVGVGQVNVGGSALPAVRVEINPTQLSHLGISLEDVRTALSNANTNRPKGELSDEHNSWGLSTTDQLLKADQYQPLIIKYANGAPVQLSDVALVRDSVENVRTAGMVDGKECGFDHHIPPAGREHYRYRRSSSRRTTATRRVDLAGNQPQSRDGSLPPRFAPRCATSNSR